MSDMKLSRPLLLVGCGKMGSAMLSGWLESGIAAGGVIAVEPMGMPPEFSGVAGVDVVASADELTDDLDPEVVVFAVKPQQMDDVTPAYRRFAGCNTAFLSIAAGKNIAYFTAQLGDGAVIVRAMPNTPAAIGKGITALYNGDAPDHIAALASQLLSAIGEVVVLDDESQMDAVTAVSGSGPAYVFLLAEVMTAAGIKVGLPPALAKQLAEATVSGAGALVAESDDPPSQLRVNVTSKGGTTAAALAVLMAEDGMAPLLEKAIRAARDRSVELGG